MILSRLIGNQVCLITLSMFQSRLSCRNELRLLTSPAVAHRVMSSSSSPFFVSPPPADIKPGPEVKEESKERDLVNFPRYKMPDNHPPVSLGIIPESWFTFFAPKTGATGGYVFAFSFGTFLFSKELYICDHEFYVGLALFVTLYGVTKAIGPSFGAILDKMMAEQDQKLASYKTSEIVKCEEAIAKETEAQNLATGYEHLIEARKENVQLQLEEAYRERLAKLHQEVKRRLDYQVEVNNVHRRFEQKHMAEWIMGSVRKAITAKQEEETLKKCIVDLKSLAKQ